MTKNKYQIFIDMDGIFVDFLGGCFKWFSSEKTIEDWPVGQWGNDIILNKMFGTFGAGFWTSVANDLFWSTLEFTEDGKEFLEFISPYKPVILTAPSYKSATGKQIWIKNNLPKYYKDKRYLIGPAKKYVARPWAILIDDCEANIEDWKKEGGIGILYPRRWNRYYKNKNSLLFVKDVLNAILTRRF